MHSLNPEVEKGRKLVSQGKLCDVMRLSRLDCAVIFSDSLSLCAASVAAPSLAKSSSCPLNIGFFSSARAMASPSFSLCLLLLSCCSLAQPRAETRTVEQAQTLPSLFYFDEDVTAAGEMQSPQPNASADTATASSTTSTASASGPEPTTHQPTRPPLVLTAATSSTGNTSTTSTSSARPTTGGPSVSGVGVSTEEPVKATFPPPLAKDPIGTKFYL